MICAEVATVAPPQVPSSARLWLFAVSVALLLQFPPNVLLAMMVFLSVVVPMSLTIPPPLPALLPEKVLLVTFTVPPFSLEMPPPTAPVELLLPEKVL